MMNAIPSLATPAPTALPVFAPKQKPELFSIPPALPVFAPKQKPELFSSPQSSRFSRLSEKGKFS
jgi:hypothetical protein